MEVDRAYVTLYLQGEVPATAKNNHTLHLKCFFLSNTTIDIDNFLMSSSAKVRSTGYVSMTWRINHIGRLEGDFLQNIHLITILEMWQIEIQPILL